MDNCVIIKAMIESNLSSIKQVLQDLKLSNETIDVYIYICKNGHSSVLNIASKTTISRTQVYRHLDALTKLNLVSEEKPHWGTYFYALPISNLNGEIELQKQSLEEASLKLKAAEGVFDKLFLNQNPNQTINYRGISGLKQALWNVTKAEKEYKVFEVDHLSNLLDIKFSRSMRQQQIDKQIKSYDISNQKIHKKEELEPFDPNLSKLRFIQPEILKIKFEIIIYNDVVTLIDYFKPEPVAIEIKNPALSLMMNQMHGAFWAMAKEVEWQA